MTTPQEEAERRYPYNPKYDESTHWMTDAKREDFIAGAEWQSERLGPLVEAARKYGVGVAEYEVAWKALQEHFNAPEYATAVQVAYWKRETGGEELLAQAAALDGGTEAERPPESSS